MLNLYRRQQPPCRYASRRYRNCNCPIWVQGSLRGEYIRRALGRRSWSAATDFVRDWESNSRFLPWCESKGYRYLKQIGVEEMRQLRATWTDSANYATKNLERLRGFFRFCMHDDWMAKNPARAVKAPKVSDKPTLPFSQAEMQRILKACDRDRVEQDDESRSPRARRSGAGRPATSVRGLSGLQSHPRKWASRGVA